MIDSVTVRFAQPERQAICLPLGLCQGTVNGLEKTWKFPPVISAHIELRLRQSQPIMSQQITKERCQPIGGHVSYPTDCPNATRLALCSSLVS